jgi:branched-chain amino acid transport system substrate-binding protein
MRKEEPGVSAHLPWFSKNAVAVGAVVLAVGALAACSSSGSSSSSTTTPTSTSTTTTSSSPAANSTPITIGASLSLTGDFSADGTAYDQGYKLWAADVNKAGGIDGHPVKLTILNDNSDPNQVVTNYETLIDTDHVMITFGPFSSLLTTPASAVAARNGYAFVEGAGGAPTVFDTSSNEADHNVFDVSLPVADEFLPFINYIKSLPLATRQKLTAAYPSAQDPFATPPVSLAQQELTALGVKEVYSETFPEEVADYKAPADDVASLHPDIVVLGSTDVPTVAAFMQAFEQNHYVPEYFIAAAGPDQGAAFQKAVGDGDANGMMVPDGWYPGVTNSASVNMVNEYVKEYGGVASGVNADIAEAYSVGQVVEQAIVATGYPVSNTKIIAYLHSGVTLTSVQGPVKFDSLGENALSDAYVFQWQKAGTDFVQVLPASDPLSKPNPLQLKSAWTSS